MMCFLECFLVFGREKKKHRKQLGKRKISEKCVLPVWGVPRAIYSPKHENRGGSHCKAAGGLSMAAGLNPPLIGLILTPLDRS